MPLCVAFPAVCGNRLLTGLRLGVAFRRCTLFLKALPRISRRQYVSLDPAKATPPPVLLRREEATGGKQRFHGVLCQPTDGISLARCPSFQLHVCHRRSRLTHRGLWENLWIFMGEIQM